MAVSQKEVDKKVFSYYEKDGVHNHYTKLWGEGNIHFGYFPNLLTNTSKFKNIDYINNNIYENAATELTYRMCEQSQINQNSIVLDLGCGYGKPACDIALKYGCKVIGIDLSQTHIQVANNIVKKINNDRLQNTNERQEPINVQFYVASFTEYPNDIKNMSFTHIFTQAAFCHAHNDLYNVINNASKQLINNGIIVINDVLSNKKAKKDTKKYVYERMSFPYLIGTDEYTNIVRNCGFEVKFVENLNEHLWLSYKILSERGKEQGFNELAFKYYKTCQSIENDEYGMVTIVARKGTSQLYSKM